MRRQGFPALTFSLLIFVFDETRRYLIRRHRREYGRPGFPALCFLHVARAPDTRP